MTNPGAPGPRPSARHRFTTGRWVGVVSLLAVGSTLWGAGPAGAAGKVSHRPASAPAPAQAPRSSAGLNAEGSSFAGPEVQQWGVDVAKSPYNLNVNYISSSSGSGRSKFAAQTIDFAVTDIPFQPFPYDTTSPTFRFIYVPVTAGGLAFMYHINGLSGTLQLSSYSACAVMTGAVAYWDDPIVKADNPGVALPHVQVHAVTRADLAGTNFVFQEYCIHEQGALWAAFVNSPTIQHLPNQVPDLSATQARSDWPLFPTAIPVSGSAQAADTVANPNDDGYITAVETAYALQRGFRGGSEGTASVKNASGQYAQPTPVDVASALAYASQLANGTHVLNFDGLGPHVYNPSTYSYLVTATTGWSSAKGNVLSQFVDYALTLGQQKAPEIGYASLGLSLENFGVNAVKTQVPGAVAPTAAEQTAYACGDLTPSEVQVGQTTPTCGVTNPTTTTTPSGVTPHNQGTVPNEAATSPNGTATLTGTGGSTSGNGLASAVDPGVSLAGADAGLAYTGLNPVPVVALGAMAVVGGWLTRRRLIRGRPVPGSGS